jgi:malate dehydrogenase (oxaloacetate-decarboxylating)
MYAIPVSIDVLNLYLLYIIFRKKESFFCKTITNHFVSCLRCISKSDMIMNRYNNKKNIIKQRGNKMTNSEKALQMHEQWNGKIETTAKAHVNSREDLAIAYTPGVAEPCKVIAKDPDAAYKYTIKANTIAVVSDGSAVLGLGNIGARAAMPVMEGKAVLFKKFGGVNAVPICLDTQDTEEIIKTIVNIAPAFGGINLEDISAPRCFEIEERLKELLDIPVFHDDQHGTAIVVLAGVINALKVTGKAKESCKVVVNGAGSAGVAITKLLLTYGFQNVTMCDINGIISKASPNLNWMQKKMTEVTNLEGNTGTLADALKGADIFVGVSAPNIVTKEMVASMNQDAILFAMANPVPEIMPDLAKEAGAKVVGTGRSDFPNQVNNVVAFPGIFKGALEGRAAQITEEMKLATAKAIAGLVPDEELNENNILPEAFDPRVADAVSKAVKELI